MRPYFRALFYIFGLGFIAIVAFNQMHLGSASQLVIGKNDTLFEKDDLNRFSKTNALSDTDLKQLSEKLQHLQRGLDARGVKFLLLISPSKAEIYADLIPKHHIDQTKGTAVQGNYNRLLPMLRELQINMVDSPQLMFELRKLSPYPVFPKGGTYWSEWASCFVAQHLVKEFENHLGQPLRQISCEPFQIREQPSSFDNNLAERANLSSSARFKTPLPYPASKTVAPSNAYRPKVLFVGTAFLWPVLNYLDQHRVYATRDFYYNFERNFRFRNNESIPRANPISQDTINWETQVFSKDIVLLEINQAMVDQSGSGFIDAALSQIAKDKI